MITQILTATILYMVFNFIFTYYWNLKLFKPNYDKLINEISRDNPLFPLGIMAMITEGISMSLLFFMFFDGKIGTAFSISYLAGLFSALYGALVVPAKFKVESIRTFVSLELVHGFIQFTGLGLILYFIF